MRWANIFLSLPPAVRQGATQIFAKGRIPPSRAGYLLQKDTESPGYPTRRPGYHQEGRMPRPEGKKDRPPERQDTPGRQIPPHKVKKTFQTDRIPPPRAGHHQKGRIPPGRQRPPERDDTPKALQDHALVGRGGRGITVRGFRVLPFYSGLQGGAPRAI